MQTVNVRLFAGLQQMVGQRAFDLEVPDRATVAQLRERLVEEYPILEAFMGTLVCAIDEEMVPVERVLAQGDQIELIPPIAGGEPLPIEDESVLPQRASKAAPLSP